MTRISSLLAGSVAASIAACALLCGCQSPQNGAPAPGAVSSADTVQFKVEGMACPNCAKHVAETLQTVPGVKSAKVDFDTKMATVVLDSSKPASMSSLKNAVSAWTKEHFAQEEDPECLDPAKRKEMQGAAKAGAK